MTIDKNKNQPRGMAHPLSIAPMMEWTDRHFRYFLRLITKRTLLYSEMVTTAAILYGDREKLLGFSPEEKPISLQLGGDDPVQLSECARIGQDMGYDEINLNVGCPSDRVQSGRFGACLMAKPEIVASCVEAMRSATSIPVTVKHRIGIDNLDRYSDLKNFVSIVSGSGCDRFIAHARIAILNGLSPKENRSIPPLRYEDVYRLKKDFPFLKIELNGGVKTMDDARHHLNHIDGVMLGRIAYDDPYILASADSVIYHEKWAPPSRREIMNALIPYLDECKNKGVRLQYITRHILGLFSGQPMARSWRRFMTENLKKENADTKSVSNSLRIFADEILDDRPVLLKIDGNDEK